MHKLPQLPEPAYPFGTKGMLCENAFDADQMRAYALTYGQQCAQAQGEAQAAEIARLKEELARTERNRDMWKGQVERQAERLADTHAALSLIVGKKRPSTAGVSDSGQASDLSMMVMTLKEIARAALKSEAA